MKNLILHSFTALLICLLFASCEKVIDINLNNTSSQLVVEANITKGQPCVISISKTVNFDQSNIFPTVNGADILLTDDAGNSENLIASGNGTYVSTSIIGVEGRKYNLKVKVDGKEYIANSTLPYQINFDTLKTDELAFIGGKIIQIIPEYKDSLGIKNYYRFKLFVNNEPDKSIFVDDDEFTDGRTVSRPLFSDLDIVKGDTILLQMLCIDQPAYLYFNSLSQTRDNSTGAPANPVSNFSGGCLGYFSANTKQERSVIVQ